jgi:hypothetical protein
MIIERTVYVLPLDASPSVEFAPTLFHRWFYVSPKTSIMTCPCCESIIHSWDTVYPQANKRHSELNTAVKESTFELPIISPKLDAIHSMRTCTVPRQGTTLLASPSRRRRMMLYVHSLFEHSLLNSDCNEWGSAQLGFLEYLFKIL